MAGLPAMIDAAKHAKLVALVIPRATTLAYPELLPELCAQLAARSLRPVMFVIDHEGDADRAIDDVAGLPLAGIVAAARPSERCLSRLKRSAVPLFLYNCHGAHSPHGRHA